jgi:hypothetical protein
MPERCQLREALEITGLKVRATLPAGRNAGDATEEERREDGL